MITHEKFEAKILVLDDEKLIRLTVCARLKKAGYESIAVGSVDEAVSILKQHHRSFCAIISDIMMGDMDGFVFRDIVRGIDPAMPFFFMTALDPEEGSGFLKKIIGDPMSYYLPKSAGTEVLIKRLQRVVGARRIQQFVERQVAEQRQSLRLAAHVQRSMLPVRAMMDDRCFYTTLWRPHESVSGDLYEAMQIDANRGLFALGDIQGHGANAALVMMAVQAFMRQIVRTHAHDSAVSMIERIANELQKFFRANFTDISYMTAVIAVYAPPVGRDPGVDAPTGGSLAYIVCGAPDIRMFSPANLQVEDLNPEKRGGLPIGLMPDTVYTPADIVQVNLPPGAFCAAFTDGLYEFSKDDEGHEKMSAALIRKIAGELAEDDSRHGSIMSILGKFSTACDEFGYSKHQDDVTIVLFGPRRHLPGIYEATLPLSPEQVDAAAQDCGRWCTNEGWPADLVTRVQLVLEEHLMNIHDHGFDDQQRRRDVVSLRLRRRRDHAELTVWDHGRPMPSLKVAAGDADTTFTLLNNGMSGRGRGRLMMRQLCDGIQRQSFGTLHETSFFIKENDGKAEETT